MLNKDGIRQLAYVVVIDDIKPIEGKDRVECAVVGGWEVMVKKGQFKSGDVGIYFEIDSKVPETEPFLFLAPKHFKIKTQKYKAGEGYFWSQGLLMHPHDFGWESFNLVTAAKLGIIEAEHSGLVDDKNNIHFVETESRFLTKELNVTYATESDNKRKAKSVDKYKLMAQRNGKLFSHQPFRWLMKRTWGKKLLFLFFGRKRDKRTSWPDWVKKTDEERVQNMPWILNNKEHWVVTEKIDGSSTTFTLKRKGKSKKRFDFYVCSRNVVFDKPNKPCFYDTNIYLEMEEKYDIKNKMIAIINKNFPSAKWITIQGETFGKKVQNRDYGLEGHDFKAFNFIVEGVGRWGTIEMKNFLEGYGIPCVPIVYKSFILPDTIEELLIDATGESKIDKGMREGFVFRTLDGQTSFKVVSNEYLDKYHS